MPLCCHVWAFIVNFIAYLTGSADQAIFCWCFILCCHLFSSSNKRINSQCGFCSAVQDFCVSVILLHSNTWLSLLLSGLLVSDTPYSLNYLWLFQLDFWRIQSSHCHCRRYKHVLSTQEVFQLVVWSSACYSSQTWTQILYSSGSQTFYTKYHLRKYLAFQVPPL